MRLPDCRKRCGMDGEDGEKELALPFKNPFVHELRFTPLQKLRVRL